MKRFSAPPHRARLATPWIVLLLLASLGPVFGDVIPADRLPPGGWSRSNVGVEGGIPNVTTIYCNVKESIPGHPGLVAVGDGVTDDHNAIETAVWECAYGQVVYIPEGTYYLSDQLYFNADNNCSKILRGAGPGKTKLIFHLTNSTNCITFYGNSWNFGLNVVGGFQRGSTQIVVNDVTYVHPGQTMYLMMQNNWNNDMFLAAQGYAPDQCIHQSFSVVATDPATNTITVDRPIYYAGYSTDPNVTPSLTAGIDEGYIKWCGVEDLYLENATPNKGQANIFFQGAKNCWVKNVESVKPNGWNIRFQYSRRCEVRQCVIHDGWNGGGDTMYGTGFYKMNCDNLVEDNIYYHCRHSMLTEYGNQGNVFGYNYSFDPVNEGQLGTDFLMSDMIAHGGLPMFNLYEGNVVARMTFDYELGGNRNLTAFRNWIWRKGLTVGDRAVEIARNGLYNNIVGNIFLTPDQMAYQYNWGDGPGSAIRKFGYRTDGDVDVTNADPRVGPSTLWHMNWDFQFQGSINYLDPSVSDTNLRASYYYTSKPPFWTDGLPWPAIGPDLTPKTGGNPAYLRWQQRSTRPAAPTGLRVIGP